MGKAGNLGSKLLNSNSLVYTFLRSAVSSQAASWADLFIGFALFAWTPLGPWLSTAIGALVGGAINCVINYHFTFHAKGNSWKAVAVKYAMVWAGSLLLNAYGTQAVYFLLSRWDWLATIGFEPNGYYAAARLSVSLAVSWFWNFLLQRYFVYRETRFDIYAIKFINLLFPKKKSQDKTSETSEEEN